MVKDFIEGFHEQMEELYIFPMMRAVAKFEKIIDLLIAEHIASSHITTAITNLANTKKFPEMRVALAKFIKLYRLHSLREDTIIFRKFRKLVGVTSSQPFQKRWMKTIEDEKFGPNAYDCMLEKY